MLAVFSNEERALDESDLSGGKQQTYDLASREVKAARGNTGTICTIAIAVSESETVTVDANAADGMTASCAMAKKAAPMVEAKLPES